jgi:hypothetical protein
VRKNCYFWLVLLLNLTLVLSAFSGEPLRIETRPAVAPRETRLPEEMPFYVFNNAIYPPVKNFAPSGFMGDINDIKLAGSYKVELPKGYPCLKLAYTPAGKNGWIGIKWQNPPNNWGKMDGGYNLSAAKKLTFCAKGEKGGEVVEFLLGGILSEYPDTANLTAGDITLDKEWTMYIIDLSRADLSYISGGFCFVVTKDNNPQGCTFYLDNIKYEK